MQFEWSAVGASMGRMFLILLLAWLAVSVSGRVTHRARMFLRDRSTSAEDAKRVDTLGRVLRYAVTTVVALVAGLMILSELGVQIAPLLGAAGVVGIAYREDVHDALAIMRTVGGRMCRDEAWQHKILEPLELIGVERLADSAVVLRCRFKVVPPEQWSVRREYLRRIKRAFDEGGIEIPFPQLTIHSGQSKRVAEELEQQR